MLAALRGSSQVQADIQICKTQIGHNWHYYLLHRYIPGKRSRALAGISLSQEGVLAAVQRLVCGSQMSASEQEDVSHLGGCSHLGLGAPMFPPWRNPNSIPTPRAELADIPQRT